MLAVPSPPNLRYPLALHGVAAAADQDVAVNGKWAAKIGLSDALTTPAAAPAGGGAANKPGHWPRADWQPQVLSWTKPAPAWTGKRPFAIERLLPQARGTRVVRIVDATKRHGTGTPPCG